MGGGAVNIQKRMKNRRTDSSVPLSRVDWATRRLKGCSNFTGPMRAIWLTFFDKLGTAEGDLEPFEADKKDAVETVKTLARNELGQLGALSRDEAREFMMIVTSIIDIAFEARHAERLTANR